jgi:hypothetical protein
MIKGRRIWRELLNQPRTLQLIKEIKDNNIALKFTLMAGKD